MFTCRFMRRVLVCPPCLPVSCRQLVNCCHGCTGLTDRQGAEPRIGGILTTCFLTQNLRKTKHCCSCMLSCLLKLIKRFSGPKVIEDITVFWATNRLRWCPKSFRWPPKNLICRKNPALSVTLLNILVHFVTYHL